MRYYSTSRLAWNADRSRVVADTDVDAAFLLCGEGKEVHADVAESQDLVKRGLARREGEPVKAAQEAKAIEAPPMNKAKAKPKANK